jgi:hypothetical protein
VRSLYCTGAGSAQQGSGPPSPLSLQLSDGLGLSLEDLQVLDSEGRALITDHGLFVLVNLYGEPLLRVFMAPA